VGRDIKSNLDDVVRKLRARGDDAESYLLEMKTTATSRTARENAQILWIHWHGGRMKNKKRRPWFTSAAEWRRIQKAFQDALMSGEGNLKAAAEVVGREVKDVYSEHVKEGKSARGQIQALSPRYKKWKDSKYPGKPIMVRSGQLLKSIKPEVKKI
jgi:hypothetical protein